MEPASGSFFLFGPRGTGKSTWLGQRFPEARFVDLLSPAEERHFAARPERLEEVVRALPDDAVVVLDEVQRVPALLPVVHRLIEAGSWRFVLTGSSARKIRRAGVDLLGGRAAWRSMHPFMAAEQGPRFDVDTALTLGQVPLIRRAPSPPDALAAYVGLYLEQEVKAEGLVRRIGDFARFLEVVSFSHAQQLNVAEVARECAIGRKTVEGWIGVLEDLLLAFRLPVFRRRAKRATVVRPKLYLFDAGIFRSLRPAGPLDRPEEIGGAALEGLVAQHLRAWIDYRHTRDALFYWRTSAGREVDFVVYGPETFTAIEVKSTAAVRPKDLRGLRAFRDDYPDATAVLLYRGEPLEIGGIPCLPVDVFLRRLSIGGLPFSREAR